MRVVGILGASYTGTTVPLSYCLDNLPGVFACGESHWLAWPEGRAARCSCGKDFCDVWFAGARMSLADHQRDWWDRIGESVGAECVVSADKEPRWFDRLGCPCSVIVSWKDPRAWVASWLRHNHQEPADENVKAATNILVNCYAAILKWVTSKYKRHRWTGFDLETFCAGPEGYLALICDRLGLPFDSNAVNMRGRTHHLIEGNRRAVAFEPDYQREFGFGVEHDDRFRDELREDQHYAILEATDEIRGAIFV